MESESGLAPASRCPSYVGVGTRRGAAVEACARTHQATAARERADERADRLFHRYRQLGDRHARDELVERYMPLARSVARRFHHTREPMEDLVQVASMALVKAIDGFDADRGTAFSSYAVPTILGEIKRYFRDSCWDVYVPRGVQERAVAANQAITRLSRLQSRSPSPDEIAGEIDCT